MSLSPAAFFSYVRFVDQHEEGRITELCRRLEGEIRIYLGDEFSIFQDREIGWGYEWKSRIDEALDAATFFIPVLTPAFFKSRYCREELGTFLEREKKLRRRDLVLPIYYVDTLLFNDTGRRGGDPLAEVLATRQYIDWRSLRFEPWAGPQVSRRLSQMAVQIRDALDSTRPSTKNSGSHGTHIGARGRVFQVAASQEGNVISNTPPSSRVLKEPPSHIVDPLHRGDFVTISAAIAAASPGDRILVRPGFYSEGLLMEKPLEILGDGSREEIVVQAAEDSVLVFRTTMGRVKNLTLRKVGNAAVFGVDIAQGRLELEDCDISNQGQTCVAIHAGADPRLRRNRIHHGKHSGVFVFDHGQGTLEENEIFGNGLWGIENKEGGSPVARNNRIHGNQVGIFVNEGGQGLFESNEIFDNSLSGFQAQDSNPAVRNNRIYNNQGFGVWVGGGAGLFEGNEIFGSAYHGVVVQDKGNPIFRRNRIHGSKQGGIIVLKAGQGIFDDNEVFDNILSGALIETAGKPTLRYNRIHDNREAGVFVYREGQGTLEDNDISSNSEAGVEVVDGGSPILRRNRLTDNSFQAIHVGEGGGGVFESNDLRGNSKGAWKIDPERETQVKRSENLE